MYAMVLFLVVITSTSSILSVSSNNDGDQEIFMVVDDPTSMHHAGMGMSKAVMIDSVYDIRQGCAGGHRVARSFGFAAMADVIIGLCLNKGES
ncbi:hypothetical protein Tco_1323434 [Tanacetum coccineum]